MDIDWIADRLLLVVQPYPYLDGAVLSPDRAGKSEVKTHGLCTGLKNLSDEANGFGLGRDPKPETHLGH